MGILKPHTVCSVLNRNELKFLQNLSDKRFLLVLNKQSQVEKLDDQTGITSSIHLEVS